MTPSSPLAGESDSPLGEPGEGSPVLMLFAVWALLFTSLAVAPIVAVVFAVVADEGTLPIVRLILAYCVTAWVLFGFVFWRGTNSKVWASACLALAIAPYCLAAFGF